MAGTQRVKEQCVAAALNLGHRMGPYLPYGDKEVASCENVPCTAKIIVQGEDASGHALTDVCPYIPQGNNGGLAGV